MPSLGQTNSPRQNRFRSPADTAPAQTPAFKTGAFSRRSLLGAGAGLGAATLLPSLSGCASGRNQPLQFWNFYAPQDQGGEPQLIQQADWFNEAIGHWNANHSEQIQPVFIADYANAMNPRVATAFAADNGPDIFLISPGEFLRYYNGGVLTDLAPFMTADAIADFEPAALETRRVGNGIFALPMEVEPLSIYYDVAAFEETGLSEGDLPSTWDQLLDVAEKLSTPKRSGLVLETQPGYYQNFTFYPWVWQGGGDVIDPATQRATTDSESVLGALKFFADSISQGVAPRTLPASGEIVSAFTQGLAAMWQRGPWSISEFELQAPEHRYGSFPLPTPPGGRPTTVAGGWAWAVNNRGRNPDAAARFVVESIGAMTPESIARGADWNGRAKSNLPARKSVTAATESLPSYSDPHRADMRTLLPSVRSEPRYPPVMYKALSNAIQSVQLAGGDPVQEARTAHEAIGAFLDTYEGAPLV